MNLKVIRDVFTPNSTTGKLYIDGVFQCYTLEPTDRGLNSSMPLDKIKAVKIQDKTAIPYGTYDVQLYASPKRGYIVPMYMNVPGFTEVEMHVGNYPKDTDSCTLLGLVMGNDFVGSSKEAIDLVYPQIKAAIGNSEAVTITFEHVSTNS